MECTQRSFSLQAMAARPLINRFISTFKTELSYKILFGEGNEVLIACASFPEATLPFKPLYYTRLFLGL